MDKFRLSKIKHMIKFLNQSKEELKKYNRDKKLFIFSKQRKRLGNLIVRKGEGKKKLMLASHMDEIGLMVKHIDKQGFIRFTTLGGLEEDIAILEKKQRFLHSFFYEGMGTDFSLREI